MQEALPDAVPHPVTTEEWKQSPWKSWVMYDIEICLGRHSCIVCPFSPLVFVPSFRHIVPRVSVSLWRHIRPTTARFSFSLKRLNERLCLPRHESPFENRATSHTLERDVRIVRALTVRSLACFPLGSRAFFRLCISLHSVTFCTLYILLFNIILSLCDSSVAAVQGRVVC